MTPQELKTSILWNAIQGKLTQQVECESAEDILNGLSLSPIAEEECYFDIPSNWKWCKIKDVFTLVNGKAFKPTDWGQTGLPIVRIQNLNDPSAPFNYFSGEIEEKYILNGGELLFSWSGTPGTSFGAFIWHGGKAVLNQHIFIVYPSFLMDTKYAMYALNGELKVFIEKAHGGAGLKHITKKEFENCGLPIPPLAEQKRIVAKLEEILPLIDRYEVAWNKLEEFNKRFPGDMQKSILQLAIQGKLVEQRPEEGTGEELFRQIQTEKQALIKAGKIKKEKPLPDIAEDELPFDIPESWKWVRLRDIISVLGDGIHGTPVFDDTGGYYFVNGNNLVKGKIVFKTDTKKVSIDEYEKHKKPLDENTILISINGTIGNYAFYAGEPIILGKSACYFSVLTGIDKEFIRHLINTKFFMDYAVKEATQTTIKNVSLKAMRMFPVPLPPLAEQKRIVAKLEEILPLCERLK